MIKSKITLVALMVMSMLPLGGCQLLASPFVRSIIISVGTALVEKVLVKAGESLIDQLFGSSDPVDKATTVVNDNFYSKVHPIPENVLLGRIPGDGSLGFAVNGERGGQQNNTMIQISNSVIAFQREDATSNNWKLLSYSEGMIRNRLAIAAAQISLQNFGYELGEIDGIIGRQTRAALKKFQKSRGQSQTGELDEVTKSMLLTQ